jgi:hypothetical protein
MSELEIRTHDGKTVFMPGEEVVGEVSWRLDAPQPAVELRLFWHTQGKGTSDVSVVDKISFDNPARQERRDFRFRLPDAPYSFSGKLISLEWALELIVPSPWEIERLPIVISPTGAELVLHPERARS